MKPIRKTGQSKPPAEAAAADRKQTRAVDPPPLSLGRRVLFTFVALAILPLLGLCLLEAALRIGGFGRPTSFFVPRSIGGKKVLVENPWFGLRFFPPALARSPSPAVMELPKRAGVCRIFLFGESAAMGDPRPAFGIGRYLETLLRERFPRQEFEVVCVAMTAINSHAILPLARECVRYEGDLWVIYMGNNEFYGPFGAGTVFGSRAPPNRMTRAYLALQRARAGQWLVWLARKLSSSDSPKSWGGLKMFLEQQLAPDDPRKLRVYENFRDNLEDILQAGVKSGVPILLSTVASNLKDCAPLGSLHTPSLNPAAMTEWQALYQTGITNAWQGLHAQAVSNFQTAALLSPKFAELHYRLGRSLLALTNQDAARQSFLLARDLDTLPFRTDGKLNRIIADLAGRYSDRKVALVDAEQVLASSALDHISGEEFFFEHVHFTAEGNYRLAKALAEQALVYLPSGITNQQTAAWADFDTASKRLGLTDWNRLTILEDVGRRLAEAPLSNRYDNPDRKNHLRVRAAQLKTRMGPREAKAAQATLDDAIRNRSSDHWLHHNYAEFLALTGKLQQATEEMTLVRDFLPHHYAAHFQLGRLLARQSRYDEARQTFEAAVRLRPDVAEAYIELGQLAAAQGSYDEALKQYAAAQTLHQDDARVCLLRAGVLDKQNKRTEAIQSLREAIRLRPSLAEAYDLLGIRLAVDGNFLEAEAAFTEYVRLKPDDAEGHLNLGIALARQQKLGEAMKHFQRTLELDARNQRAREFIQAIQEAKR